MRYTPCSNGPYSDEIAPLSEADGLAALGICESLRLALNERKIISNDDLRGLLTDVVTTHIEAAYATKSPETHHAVVEIVQRNLGSNPRSARLPAISACSATRPMRTWALATIWVRAASYNERAMLAQALQFRTASSYVL